MTFLFWILAIAMLAAALALVLLPLLRPRQLFDRDLNQLNVAIAKERLKELEQEYQSGQHSEEQYQQAKQDLEKQLVNDLSDEQQQETASAKGEQNRPLVITLAAAVPVLAIGFYLYQGNLDGLNIEVPDRTAQGAPENNPSQNPMAQGGKSMPSVDEMVASLAAKLEAEPNNPQGWYMLARSYMVVKRYDQAVKTWERLLALVGPDQPQVLVQYADALAMTQGGRLSGEPAKQIFKALDLDPENVQGLWLAGMAMMEQHDPARALEYWRKLEPKLAESPESQTELRNLIANAEQSLGGEAANKQPLARIDAPNAQLTNNAKPADTQGQSIRVEIDLAPTLAAKVAVEDTLFIYAKALKGPPMPLAAVRKTAADMPLTLVLDDSMAMMPQMKLSNFQQVKVGARISKSGGAMAQDGDFYAEVMPVTVGQQQVVKIVINQIKGQEQQVVAPTVAPAQAVSADSVNINVTLDDSLTAKASPDDTLFIYAKALQGPPMPLAAVRKQVKDLPLTLTLNDSMAMMPQMKLSKFQQVVVGARVSKSGNAMGQPGDLYGEVKPVQVGQAEPVNIVIQQVRQ